VQFLSPEVAFFKGATPPATALYEVVSIMSMNVSGCDFFCSVHEKLLNQQRYVDYLLPTRVPQFSRGASVPPELPHGMQRADSDDAKSESKLKKTNAYLLL